jgi:hypothetical protein
MEPGTAGAGGGRAPRDYMPSELLLEGSFPVLGVYAVPPLVDAQYVYWSPGDKTIRRAGLRADSRVEVIYTGTQDLSVRAVGGGYAYFANHGDAPSIGRVKIDGSDPQPVWAADTALADSAWLVVGGVVYGGGMSVVGGKPVSSELYVDGSCVMKPGTTLGACFDIEVDFAQRSTRSIVQLSHAGASGLGVFASNADSWFAVDGDESFTGEGRVLRIPHGGGTSEVVYRGTRGTVYIRGMADAEYLYLRTDNCHRMAIAPLSAPDSVWEGDVMLNANGPCIQLIELDAEYGYFNTAHGLVRVKLKDLRALATQ